MVDVLFIHINKNAPIFSSDAIPISEGYILAYLKQKGYSGQILVDLKDRPLNLHILKDFLERHTPIVVGFSTYQATIERARFYACFIKKFFPKIKIVFGGPQVTFMPAQALEDLGYVDILARGEGEIITFELLRCLKEGKGLDTVPGIAFLDDGKIYDKPVLFSEMPLDNYPSPYLSNILDIRGKGAAILFTSRGCPFNCKFCYTPPAFNRTVRFHSIDRVLEEIEYILRLGIRRIWFADPNFSFLRDRLEIFLDELIRRRWPISFWCQTRCDLVDKDLLKKLKRAGAEVVAYGLESASDKVLKAVNKKLDLKRLSQVIKLTQQVGLKVELFSIYGLPEETFKEAYKTIKFVKDHNIPIEGNSSSQQLQLYFGTELCSHYREYGFKPLSERPRYLSICTDFETKWMSKEDIEKIKSIWILNNRGFLKSVSSGKNFFKDLGFLIKSYEALKHEKEYYPLILGLLRDIEEWGLFRKYLILWRENLNLGPSQLKAFFKGFPFFQETNSPVKRGFRVLLDMEGYLGSIPIPETFSRYYFLTLGRGQFLPTFEQRLYGIRAKEGKVFKIRFPEAYTHNLAGKEVTFRIYIQKVYRPIYLDPNSLQLNIKNDYTFSNLKDIKRFNEALYYLCLKQNKALEGEPLLDYLDFLLYLDRLEEVRKIGTNIPKDSLASLFFRHQYYKEALDIYKNMPKLGYYEAFNLACCYFKLNRLKETEKTLEEIYNEENLYLLHLLNKTYLLLGDRKRAREISLKLASAKVDFQLSQSRGLF